MIRQPTSVVLPVFQKNLLGQGLRLRQEGSGHRSRRANQSRAVENSGVAGVAKFGSMGAPACLQSPREAPWCSPSCRPAGSRVGVANPGGFTPNTGSYSEVDGEKSGLSHPCERLQGGESDRFPSIAFVQLNGAVSAPSQDARSRGLPPARPSGSSPDEPRGL